MARPTPLTQQRQLLDRTRSQLKHSHIGLDAEIDRLLNAVAPWLLLNATQQRPRVVGLWGMTGTGKSSLVRELVRHLGLEERTCWLDAGECRRPNWLEARLELMKEHLHGQPMVLVIDEFQHARTVKGGPATDEPAELRRLWELMDVGRALLVPRYRHADELLELHDQLARFLQEGGVVANGRVVKGVRAHRTLFAELDPYSRKGSVWALPHPSWHALRSTVRGPISSAMVQRHLEQLDGPGLLAYLQERLAEARTPTVFDARRALVIVLGNLDGLYATGQEPLAELDPDVLVHRHRRWSLAGVQHALLELFRLEQVARLGSDHIVFPPLGRATVRGLVRREADELAARTGAQLGVPITLGEDLLERLQRDAAIAVLGARPVVEAAHQAVPALLAQVMLHPWSDRMTAVRLDVDGPQPIAVLAFRNGSRRMSLTWPLAARHAATRPREVQRRIALHEAGHVLCGVHLAGRQPLQACAHTTQESTAGFVVWAVEEAPLTRADVVPRMAGLLGGRAAEQLAYGPEGVSIGCEEDLRKATELALDGLKRFGLGADPCHHAEHAEAPGGGLRTALHEVEAQARQWVREAEELALATLRARPAELHHLADALLAQGSLDADQLAALTGTPVDRRAVVRRA